MYFIFPNKFVTCRLTLLKNSSWTWRKLKFIPYRHPELTNSRAFSLYRDVLCSISLELDPDLSLISNLHLKYGHFLFAPSLTVPSSLCAATAKTFTSDSPYPDSKLLAEAVVDSSPDLLSPLHPHRHARIGHPPPVPLWPPFCGLPPKLFRIGVLQTTTSSLNCPNLQSTGCCAPTITPQSLQGLHDRPQHRSLPFSPFSLSPLGVATRKSSRKKSSFHSSLLPSINRIIPSCWHFSTRHSTMPSPLLKSLRQSCRHRCLQSNTRSPIMSGTCWESVFYFAA